MGRRLWIVFACLAALVAGVAVAGAGARTAEATGADRAPRGGGTVVYGQDVEPRSLNPWTREGRLFATSEVLATLLDSGMRYDPRGRLVPVLFAGRPKVLRRDPLTVRFAYKRQARWSDGTPVTAADWKFTWETLMARSPDRTFRWDIASREGWEDVLSVATRGKAATVVFRRPYAAWKPLVASAPLPAHALRGEDFDRVWRDGLVNPKTGQPLGSGPFLFRSWERGRELTVIRNRRYWGRRPYLDAIVFRFMPSVQRSFDALRRGQVQLLRPPATSLEIEDARRDRRFRVQHGAEYAWEHIDFQQGPQAHPALKLRYVRRAIVAAINRRQIASTAFQPTVRKLPVSNSTVFREFELPYRPNWAIHRFDQKRAIAILRANGCTGGPVQPARNNVAVFACPSVGELSFRYTTNLGVGRRRDLMFELVRRQLRSVGIRVEPDAVPSLEPRLRAGDWDIFNFASVGGPNSAFSPASAYGCGRPLNFGNYCNPMVTRLLDEAAATTDDTRRARLLNRADALLAREVPTVPLFSLPGITIHSRRLHGVVRNPTSATLFWNARSWWLG